MCIENNFYNKVLLLLYHRKRPEKKLEVQLLKKAKSKDNKLSNYTVYSVANNEFFKKKPKTSLYIAILLHIPVIPSL